MEGFEIVELALRLNKLPSEVEQEPWYWIRRLQLYFQANAEADDVIVKKKTKSEKS